MGARVVKGTCAGHKTCRYIDRGPYGVQGQWRETYGEWYKKAAAEEDEASKAAEAGSKHAVKAMWAMLGHAEGTVEKADFAPWMDGGSAPGEGGREGEGRPLSESAGRMAGEVKGALTSGRETLGELGDEAQKVLTARRKAIAWRDRARLESLAGRGGGSGVSIWESPAAVAAHGLFGMGGMMVSPLGKGEAKKTRAAHAVRREAKKGEATKGGVEGGEGKARGRGKGKGVEGPLPPAKREAARLEREEGEGREKEEDKARGRRVKRWQEGFIQTGANAPQRY